ncbi:hypothetical protein M885DRAFT_285656 [Pelagophyceae sp. CCMP2097]|nr:hypothetical protein M885DRAFT_285656 [Pelagophyceae sp. CCMP2097]
MEAALLSARATIDDIDESISKLVQVCDDERSGWRHHRVRFNRTVRMLMEAGRTRAVISRLREYYEQSAIVAKAAAARVAGDEDMALWVRQLDVLASGDLRRLHHQDNVLHSYVLVARTRHEDDYNRTKPASNNTPRDRYPRGCDSGASARHDAFRHQHPALARCDDFPAAVVSQRRLRDEFRLHPSPHEPMGLCRLLRAEPASHREARGLEVRKGCDCPRNRGIEWNDARNDRSSPPPSSSAACFRFGIGVGSTSSRRPGRRRRAAAGDGGARDDDGRPTWRSDSRSCRDPRRAPGHPLARLCTNLLT